MIQKSFQGKEVWSVFVLKCKYCTCRSVNPPLASPFAGDKYEWHNRGTSGRLLSSAGNQSTQGSIAGRDGGKKKRRDHNAKNCFRPELTCVRIYCFRCHFHPLPVSGLRLQFYLHRLVLLHIPPSLPARKWPICMLSQFWSMGRFCRSKSLGHPWIILWLRNVLTILLSPSPAPSPPSPNLRRLH